MAKWAGCLIQREARVDSTNARARAWARQGAPHGAVIVAGEQTAGRGRRGRGWSSGAGMGLWLSMVARPKAEPGAVPKLVFAAALATADACRAVSGLEVQIKWPNDILFNGCKIAGILLEKEGDAAVIGIGINVRHREEDFPPELQGMAASLEMMAHKPISLEVLEIALLDELERRIDGWDFMPEYAARCATIGQAVRVVEADREYAGFAEGLDALGALLVRDGEGALRRVLAGDVTRANA